MCPLVGGRMAVDLIVVFNVTLQGYIHITIYTMGVVDASLCRPLHLLSPLLAVLAAHKQGLCRYTSLNNGLPPPAQIDKGARNYSHAASSTVVRFLPTKALDEQSSAEKTAL
jgi:hypothetical protein